MTHCASDLHTGMSQLSSTLCIAAFAPQVYGLMERGAAQRATGATKLNEMSSRSHAVFIIIVEKSTVMAEDSLAAEDEEMEQFRGLAPGTHWSCSDSHLPSSALSM